MKATRLVKRLFLLVHSYKKYYKIENAECVIRTRFFVYYYRIHGGNMIR